MLFDEVTYSTDAALSPLKDLIRQLVSVSFDGPIFYVILLIIACFICFEGYGIYKMALALIGFFVGYTFSHSILLSFNLTNEEMLIGQTVIGLILGALAWLFVRAGIFIAAYHLAQRHLAASIVLMIAKELDVNDTTFMIFSGIAGVIVAMLIAFLSVKAERLVIVVVTAVIGGFACVEYLRQIMTVFPYDMSFMLNAPEALWTLGKIFLAAAGVGIQGVKKRG